MLTSKQLKRMHKAIKKHETNQTIQSANPEVMEEIVAKIAKSDLWLKWRWALFYGEEYGKLIKEVLPNFNAYKKAFRKLGYKLQYENDCLGSGFSVKF
jgi:hypothetical protein